MNMIDIKPRKYYHVNIPSMMVHTEFIVIVLRPMYLYADGYLCRVVLTSSSRYDVGQPIFIFADEFVKEI